jgi:hypothetical protein
MNREVINATLEERGFSAILLDGYDDAILGFIPSADGERAHIVYSQTKCIEVLMERDKMSHTDAIEFFEFNTVRSIPYMPTEEAGEPMIVEEFIY